MKKLLAMVWLGGAAAACGQFYLEAGPWFRGGMDVDVAGGSRAAAAGATAAESGTRGGAAWVAPFAPMDDGTAQIFRRFNDGYVGPSGWAWAATAGLSQYFSYQNAGQYDAAANTLTFTAGGTASATERQIRTDVANGVPGWSGHAGLDGAGARATLGWIATEQRTFDAAVQFQVGWLDGLDASFCGAQAWSQEVTWTTVESRMERAQSWSYVYDTLGNPAFPAAPYAMTAPAGVGPMISDRPIAIEESGESLASFSRVVDRRQAVACSRVELEAEADLMGLALGPRLRFRPRERLALIAQGGITANLLDAGWTRRETFAWENGRVLQSWSDRGDDQKWLWGATVSLGAQFDVTDNLYLAAAFGCDWVEDARFTVGPDVVRYDLDGWQASMSVGWLFGGR